MQMKRPVIIFLITIIHISAFAQTPESIIGAVKNAQQNIKWASYTMKRTDTLTTGDVRSMSGSVTLQPDTNDRLFGFLFRARLDSANNEIVYDGHIGYTINTGQKTYAFSSNP